MGVNLEERSRGKSKTRYYMQEMEYVILASIMYRLETIRHILALEHRNGVPLECVMTRGMSGGMATRKARGL